MTGGSIYRLRMTGCRPVASAVVRRAQMRAAFDDLAWNFHIGRSGVDSCRPRGHRADSRDAASLRGIRLMLWRIPVCRPFPDVADHVVEAVPIWRECGDGRRTLEAIGIDILPRKFTLPGIGHVTPGGREFIAPGEFGSLRARRVPQTPIPPRWADPCPPRSRRRAHR